MRPHSSSKWPNYRVSLLSTKITCRADCRASGSEGFHISVVVLCSAGVSYVIKEKIMARTRNW